MEIINDEALSLDQCARIEHLEIASGRGKGNEILQVVNGQLLFEVNVSRGFDIRACYFKGLPVSWFSPCSHVSPQSYDMQGDEWNRGFEGGLMTTCGLEHAGCVEDAHGLHGRFSYSEAEIEKKTIDNHSIILSGAVREVKVGGCYYQIRRTITSPLFQNKIFVEDTIENCGFKTSPLMLLYHINWGYPFLGPEASFTGIKGNGEYIKGNSPSSVTKPFYKLDEGTSEVVCYTSLESEDNIIRMSISGKGIHASVAFDKYQFPYLTQWRFKGKGAEVISWEPGIVSTKGQRYHQDSKSLPYLEPGQKISFSLLFEFS